MINLNIIQDNRGFFIECWNNNAAKILGIKLRKFDKLIKKHNGIIYIYNYNEHGHRFKNKKDIENFIKELEPYIILCKLIE